MPERGMCTTGQPSALTLHVINLLTSTVFLQWTDAIYVSIRSSRYGKCADGIPWLAQFGLEAALLT